MDRKKRAAVKRYITLGLAALVTAGLAALPLLTAKTVEEGTKASILTATVQTATLERVLLGGGSIAAKDQVEVNIPSGVKVTALLAANGDTVAQGQAIAQVDRVSVMTAIQQAQEALNEITTKLAAARNQLTPGLLTVDEEGTLYSDGQRVEKEKLSSYAQFLSLSDQHREYEEILLELFRMSRLGTVNAPAAGMIDGLDKSIVQKVSFENESPTLFFLTDTEEVEPPVPQVYTCYGAQVVTVSGPQMAVMRGADMEADSLDELPTVDTASLTELALVANMPVYNIVGQDWEPYTANTGDILLVITDPEGNTFGLLQPGSSPEDPENPENSEVLEEDAMEALSGAMGSMGGGMGGSRSSQTEPELYSTAATKLCTLVSQDIMELTVSIDESDIAGIAPGMTAQVTLDALKGQQFEATVTKVSKFGTGNGGSSKFEVVLELPYSNGMLPGMNGSARMTLGQVEQVLTIPVAALVEQGNKTLVYTGYDAKEEILLNPVEVQTGFSDGETVEIKSGLTEGMPIWYSYYDTLEISNAAKTTGMMGR